MHARAQLATSTWLAAYGELERWKQQFVGNLSAAFPSGVYQNWAVCQRLFAYAKAAAVLQLEADLSRTEWATLLFPAACYAWTKGSLVDAETLAVKSLKMQKRC